MEIKADIEAEFEFTGLRNQKHLMDIDRLI